MKHDRLLAHKRLPDNRIGAGRGAGGSRGEFSLKDCLDILDVIAEKMAKVAEEYIQAFTDKLGIPESPVRIRVIVC